MFEKAKGQPVKINEQLNNHTLFYSWSNAIGQLHRLTKQYQRPEHLTPREDLTESFEKQYAPFIHQKNENVMNQITHTIETVKLLPKTGDRYQLIHSDLHSGNFHFDGKSLHMFDFDDAAYHHIISDIAIARYYTM
ncbi:phosphotransferase enzyme family protein [Alteribacter populi]|uniref:phosphotransferase enzyme family protein n=1 Tax=Alteribacter populi TaxID=2011011 RepID=UPI000BBA873D|nr:phosphotransferase [Alteribacter populi]